MIAGTIYDIICHTADGLLKRERLIRDCDLEQTIRDIVGGQFDMPVIIMASNEEEGWSHNVSEDVAQAVLERAAHEGRTLTASVRDFVERYCGTEALHELDSEAA